MQQLQPLPLPLVEPQGAAGKGVDYLQSKASCLAEAIERFLYGSISKQHLLKASYEQISDLAYSPKYLAQFSDLQRKNGYKSLLVPKKKYKNDQVIYWLPALSLISRSTRWLPYSYCQDRDQNLNSQYHDEFIYCSSNGCAGGNTPEEAIIQGFFELIERDQAAIWWYNQILMPKIDLATFPNPYFHKMERYAQDCKETLIVLDISLDWKIPVIAAISFNKDQTHFDLGLGAHVDIQIAISRALGEINQRRIYSAAPDPLSSALGKLTQKEQKYLTNYSKIKTQRDYASFKFKRMNQVVEYIVDQTKKMGFDFLVQDCSRKDIKNFFVYRTTIPGLSHMWPQLGNPRIYNVPVKCGYLNKKNNESQLNKVPLS